MKRIVLIVFFFAVFPLLRGFETEFLLPTPRELKISGKHLFGGKRCRIADGFGIPAENGSHLRQGLKRFFQWESCETAPFTLELRKIPGGGSREFYTLRIDRERIEIAAPELPGIMRGIGRLFGLAEQLRIVPEKSGVTLPLLTIRDWPEYGVRGFHFQIGGPYSDRRFAQVTELADRLSRLGFNTMIFELGGRISCPAFPEITRKPAWPDRKVKELVAFCRARGLKAFPAFNGPGHMTGAPSIFPLGGTYNNGLTDKFHSELVMDIAHPEFWKRYFAYLDRVVELFGKPEFVAIGTDEFHHGAKILEERTGMKQNVYYPAYLKKVTEYLKVRGIGCGAWHDMMVDRKRYAVSPTFTDGPANGVAGTLAGVPEECAIMFWHYGFRPRYRILEDIRREKPRNQIWVTAFSNAAGAESLFRQGRELGLDHALGSLWGFSWHRIAIPAVAEFSWNTANPRKLGEEYFRKCNDRFFFRRPAGPPLPAGKQLLDKPFVPADVPPIPLPLPWIPERLLKKRLLLGCEECCELLKPQGVYLNTPRLRSGLWFYTPAYGKSTRTNMYGEEYAVRSGVITEVSGSPYEGKKGNMKIPADGMVLSLRGMLGKFPAVSGASSRMRVGKKLFLYEMPPVPELKKRTFELPEKTVSVTVAVTVKRPFVREMTLLGLAVKDGDGGNLKLALRGVDLLTTRPAGAWKTFLVSSGVTPVVEAEFTSPRGVRELTVTPTEGGALAGAEILSITCR